MNGTPLQTLPVIDNLVSVTVLPVKATHGKSMPGKAEQDEAPKKAEERNEPTISQTIKADLHRWDYRLWMNDMDDSIWNGDKKMTDADFAVLRTRAHDDDYGQRRLMSALGDAAVTVAAGNRRHPVREYLNGLEWDGQDHIGKLSTYFKVNHPPIVYGDGTQRDVLDAFLRRWLVGAVAKIFGDPAAARSNFMIVLAGGQDIGKSHFSEWLCPVSKDYYLEKSINPDSKDVSLMRTNKVVWEVGELGATTRKADVEALKAFITTTVVTERKAYGHVETEKPAIASYIGTVNPDGSGFLSDSTGNRRFAVVEVEDINHAYATEVDIDQVWAQAMAMWRTDPKAYRMNREERAVGASNAEKHMSPDVYGDMIASVFDFDPDRPDWRVSATQVLHILRTFAGLSHGSEIAQGREVSKSLKTHWGIEGKRSGGGTLYVGMKPKDRILRDLDVGMQGNF